MDDADPVTREQQLADLAELKQATRRRHGLGRGTPEWEAAIEVERRAVDQVRSWAHPVPGSPPGR